MTIPSSATWKTESSVLRQTVAAVAMLALGLVLAFGFRDAAGPGLTNARAGFLLGVLLAAIGTGALLCGGRQVISVEPRLKRIVVRNESWLRGSTREIRFSEIAEVYVGELGDREGGSISYHVVVKLKTGKEVPLFVGFFEGGYDQAAMQARCQRLLECLRAAD